MTTSGPTHRALARYQDKSDLDRLVREHASLIDRCARTLVRRVGNDSLFDDLWSAGAMGLVEASRRFRPSEGDFNAYVEHRIRGAMLDTLRTQDHLPRRLRTRAKSVENAKAELMATLHQDPTLEQIALHVGVDIDEVETLLRLGEPLASLDGTTIGEKVAHQAPDAAEVLMRIERSEELKEALGHLPERLLLVTSLRYQEGLTFKEIGVVLGISDVRAAQLHNTAIAQLRERFSPDAAADDEKPSRGIQRAEGLPR
jgi:RNA polymerase sigma factor for flagellar operon FliA